jgi:hypothetical protein
MHIVTYISEATTSSQKIDRDLSSIIEVSKNNNPQKGITGVLLHKNGKYMQIIEGEKSDIYSLMNIIKQDPRHTNIEILFDDPIKERGFIDWGMEYIDFDNDNSFDSETLKKLSQDYKEYFEIESNVLLMFYKTILGKAGDIEEANQG